uniref:Uncharacterized protein n=1 Tax=Aquila chrysaetos chrysaetos TaxID=223781 RepID=A0A663EN47_AQUCH
GAQDQLQRPAASSGLETGLSPPRLGDRSKPQPSPSDTLSPPWLHQHLTPRDARNLERLRGDWGGAGSAWSEMSLLSYLFPLYTFTQRMFKLKKAKCRDGEFCLQTWQTRSG